MVEGGAMQVKQVNQEKKKPRMRRTFSEEETAYLNQQFEIDNQPGGVEYRRIAETLKLHKKHVSVGNFSLLNGEYHRC